MKLEKALSILNCLINISAEREPNHLNPQKNPDERTHQQILKFNFGAGRNIIRVKDTDAYKMYDGIREKKIEGLEEKYKPKLLELYKKHCLKDNDGNLLPAKNGGYIIPPQNRQALEADEEKLKAELPEIAAEMKRKQDNLDTLRETEEVEISWYKMKLSTFPKWVTGEEMSLLMDMIEDDTEDAETKADHT